MAVFADVLGFIERLVALGRDLFGTAQFVVPALLVTVLASLGLSVRARKRREKRAAAAARPSIFPLSRFSSDDDEDDFSLPELTTDWRSILRKLERKRNSRVIALIHRHRDSQDDPQGWAFYEAIGLSHLEDFLVALRSIPPQASLDIVLHSVGGWGLAVQQIARAIKAHKGKTTLFVPYYARGRSTLIALAADHIAMGQTAALSAIDPTAKFYEQLLEQKDAKKIDDFTLIELNEAQKANKETREFICELTHDRAHDGACNVATEIAGGNLSRDNPIGPTMASALGLPVSTDLPSEVFDLVRTSRVSEEDPGPKVKHFGSHSHDNLPAASDRRAQLLAFQKSGQTYARKTDNKAANAGESESEVGVSLENCSLTVRPFIAALQATRGSRVICIVHRNTMESGEFDLPTTEDILGVLRVTDPHKPLDLILHTPGGYNFEGTQIARAIKAHRGPKTAFVPYYAMSTGTLIALAADQIILGDHAVLGPIDTQIGDTAIASILSIPKIKPLGEISDEVLLLINRCQMIVEEDRRIALELMRGTYPDSAAARVERRLNSGELTHGYPLTASAARELGLNILTTPMPSEVFDLVKELRRSDSGDRSVVMCL